MITLSIVMIIYAVSCIWFWYEIYIADYIPNPNWRVVICTFTPIINSVIAVIFWIDRLNIGWDDIPNKFFRK